VWPVQVLPLTDVRMRCVATEDGVTGRLWHLIWIREASCMRCDAQSHTLLDSHRVCTDGASGLQQSDAVEALVG